MAPSESQKRASQKWDKANMIVLGCKVKREQADAFKVYCEIQGRTSNAVLRDYVLGCIGEREASQEAARAQESPGCIPVSLDTFKTAQRAAEAIGESVPDFVTRAVVTQEKRDRISLMAGINPTLEEDTKEGE